MLIENVHVSILGLPLYFWRLIVAEVSRQTVYAVLFQRGLKHHFESTNGFTRVSVGRGTCGYLVNRFKVLGHSTQADKLCQRDTCHPEM